MRHVLLAHLPEQLPWVARKGAKVFLDPRGMRAPTKLVFPAHAHVNHRRDVLVAEGLENEFILEARHQRRTETCGVFWGGDHHNHGVKALKVRHGLREDGREVLAVVRREIKHNQGLPLLPAQRLDEHVRRLIWTRGRFSTDHAIVQLFHQIRSRVLSVHLHHVNGAFHVPLEHAHQRSSSRTGWAGQQQHPGIGPFGEVPSKFIQNIVPADKKIEVVRLQRFPPEGIPVHGRKSLGRHHARRQPKAGI